MPTAFVNATSKMFARLNSSDYIKITLTKNKEIIRTITLEENPNEVSFVIFIFFLHHFIVCLIVFISFWSILTVFELGGFGEI